MYISETIILNDETMDDKSINLKNDNIYAIA